MYSEEIRKIDEYLKRYIQKIDCNRQGRTVILTIVYKFDTVEQAKEYINRVKLAQVELSGHG